MGSAKNFSIPPLLGSSLPLPQNKLIDNPVVWHTLRDSSQSSFSTLLTGPNISGMAKIVHRTHISKTKLSRYYPDVDPCCHKCKKAEASLIHMSWTCPSLEKYWREVTIYLWQTLSFASLLARCAILLRWRDAALHTHAQWLRDVISCLNLEKIHYSICIFQRKVWGPFLEYFHNLQTS